MAGSRSRSPARKRSSVASTQVAPAGSRTPRRAASKTAAKRITALELRNKRTISKTPTKRHTTAATKLVPRRARSKSPTRAPRSPKKGNRRAKYSDSESESASESEDEYDVELEKEVDGEIKEEFGGWKGALFIVSFSHLLVYYLYICVSFYKGAIQYPGSSGTQESVSEFGDRMWTHLRETAYPTWHATRWYCAFLLFEAFLSVVSPGITVKGLPLPHKDNKQLSYRCNGIFAWWFSLLTFATLHYTGVFPLSSIVKELGHFLTVAVIAGNSISLAIYFGAHLTGNTFRMRGHFWYDFFMGAWLNPRIGVLDLKMYAEIRISWILLFLITCSCAVAQYEELGFVSTPMKFMVLAHFLYTNACHKGEQCIPTTWDIFYEKWGWMIIFWNFAGVPFVYTFQSQYIYFQGADAQNVWWTQSWPTTIGLFTFLLVVYYIWDTAGSQKNVFRMQQRGTYIDRPLAFPVLPWGVIENPKCLVTKHGNKLFIDGWWAYGRKIHYAVDLCMSLSWGLSTGFKNFLPYFYFFFFLTFLSHRAWRDHERCHAKYGKDWEEYCRRVPYVYIPYVF